MRIFLLLLLCAQPIYAANFIDTLHDYFLTSKYEEKTVIKNVFPLTRKPDKENIFIFSPNDHAWALYNKEGKRVGIGKAIGGKDYCADTNETCRTVEGKFKIFRKENENCVSNTFPLQKGGGAPMPYCMFFHEGYAIHGAPSELSDDNVSHGCIRVSKKAAEWLHHHYMEEGSYVLVLPYA